MALRRLGPEKGLHPTHLIGIIEIDGVKVDSGSRGKGGQRFGKQRTSWAAQGAGKEDRGVRPDAMAVIVVRESVPEEMETGTGTEIDEVEGNPVQLVRCKGEPGEERRAPSDFVRLYATALEKGFQFRFVTSTEVDQIGSRVFLRRCSSRHGRIEPREWVWGALEQQIMDGGEEKVGVRGVADGCHQTQEIRGSGDGFAKTAVEGAGMNSFIPPESAKTFCHLRGGG